MKEKRKSIACLLSLVLIVTAVFSGNTVSIKAGTSNVSFKLSVGIAEGTQASDNYEVSYRVIQEDGGSINGSDYSGRVYKDEQSKDFSLNGVDEAHYIEIKVQDAGLGIRLNGNPVDNPNEWRSGKRISVNAIQNEYNFELYDDGNNGSGGGGEGENQPQPPQDPETVRVTMTNSTDNEFLIERYNVDGYSVNNNTVTVEKMDFGNRKLAIQEGYACKITKMTVNGTEYKDLPDPDAFGWISIDFPINSTTDTEGYTELYEIIVTEYVRTTYTIMWANDGANVEGTDFDNDEVKLSNGSAKVVKVYDNATDMNDISNTIEHLDEGCVDPEGRGSIALKEGNVVIFAFTPKYGYQLTSVSANGTKLEPQSEINQYKYIMPKTDIHFNAIFSKTEDVVKSNATKVKSTGNGIALASNELDAGSVQLSVSDVSPSNADEFVAEADGYTVQSIVDINLNQVFYKGKTDDSDVWKNNITQLNADATINLALDIDDMSNDIVLIHEKHDGTFETIGATVSNGTITFKTDSFSNYAIAMKEGSSSGGGTGSSGGTSSGGTGSSGGGSTSNIKPSTGNTTSTGVLKGDDGSWYFFKDGVVDENYDDVAQNENGWWVVRDGKVDFTYKGVATNQYGEWYCEKGKVNFNANGVLQSTAEESSGWYFVKNGKVQKGKETVEHNANGWWYIGKDGKVDFKKETVAQNAYGWWAVQKGKVDFNFKGVATNQYGDWYCEKGKVDFNFKGVATNQYGDWYCEKGKVNFNANGVLQSTNDKFNGWYFVKNGCMQKGKETVERNNYGWWYVGKDGKVDFKMNTVANNAYGWWMIKNGKVDFSYKGVAANQNGTWYLEGGKVNFNYNGKYKDANGKEYTIKNGRVIN